MFIDIKKEYDNKFNEELNKTGVFWAFSNDEFDKNKTHKDAPNSEYISIGTGCYIHKSNKEKLDNFYKVIVPKLNQELTNKVKIEDLIEYELINYECYYLGDYTLAVFAIKDFYKNMSNKEIVQKVHEVYNLTKDKYFENLDNNDIGI